MIINTTTVLAMRCPKCGKMDLHAISLFDFAGSSSKKIVCDCGATVVIMGRKNRKNFSLQVNCGMCEVKHIYYHSLKELWSSYVMAFLCMETGLEIGFIGPKDKVKEAVRNQDKTLADLAEDVGITDFFENPDVMRQVLDWLYNISQKESLTCNCGNNNIDIEIFPDRLELSCGYCGNMGVVFGETKNDLLAVKKLHKIQLSEQGFKLQEIDNPKKPRRQSKK